MSPSRPSREWKGFGNEALDSSELLQRINNVITTADFHHLESVALEKRRSLEELPTTVTCAIDQSLFTYGFHHVVVEISFSDDVFWIARIQHLSSSPAVEEAETERRDFLSEIATMKVVIERTSIPIPRVFGYRSQPSENFAFSYVLMEYLEVHTLPSSIASSVPREKMPKVAEQIAGALFDLENLTFGDLGKLWCGQDGQEYPRIITMSEGEDATRPLTSFDWFLANRREINNQALEHHPNDGPEWKAACEVLNMALQDAVLKDRLHGPFPLCHVDFHFGNLLFDDDYNLRGIVDWDGAQTVPLEKLACSPEFMTYPGRSVQDNEPIVYFRTLVRRFLEELEASATSATGVEGTQTTRLSTIIGTPRAEVIHKATYTSWRRTIFNAKYVSQLLWGNSLSWENIVEQYGQIDEAGKV